MSKKYEIIGNRKIFFSETYFLTYPGGKRELPEKQQKEWNKTLQLPGELQIKEQIKLGRENNPNVIPLKGIDLLSFIKELQFVPFFDTFFEYSKMLILNDIIVFESIRQKSYEIAMRG